jgi:hypothetical protein
MLVNLSQVRGAEARSKRALKANGPAVMRTSATIAYHSRGQAAAAIALPIPSPRAGSTGGRGSRRLGRETLRLWMIEAGIWADRNQRRKGIQKAHARRRNERPSSRALPAVPVGLSGLLLRRRVCG